MSAKGGSRSERPGRAAGEAAAPGWREPSQERSRARVRAILDAALSLALEAGCLEVKMTEVARRAGAPIGSVYQFFPTRDALLARLFAREMAPIDRSLSDALAGARTVEEVVGGVRALIARQAEMVRSRPGLALIWAASGASPALQRADEENTRRNAAVLAQRLIALSAPPVQTRALEGTALLICHLWGGVMRLAVARDDEDAASGEAALEQYGDMVAAHLARLLRAGRAGA